MPKLKIVGSEMPVPGFWLGPSLPWIKHLSYKEIVWKPINTLTNGFPQVPAGHVDRRCMPAGPPSAPAVHVGVRPACGGRLRGLSGSKGTPVSMTTDCVAVRSWQRAVPATSRRVSGRGLTLRLARSAAGDVVKRLFGLSDVPGVTGLALEKQTAVPVTSKRECGCRDVSLALLASDERE